MAKTGPVLLPEVQRLRPRPRLLWRFHNQVVGEVGDISVGFVGEANGEARGGQVFSDGDKLWWVRGVPHGENVAGEGGEGGDRQLRREHEKPTQRGFAGKGQGR